MKSHAFRTSVSADRETFTVLNACPQEQALNNGIWKSLENKTGDWADTYGAVWIVCGPVFYDNQPIKRIGDPGEIEVAIPHAFFKIVVKDRANADAIDVLAFLIPMYGDSTHRKSSADVTPHLTSVDMIEAMTGLDFLTSLNDEAEAEIEKWTFTKLWPIGNVPSVAIPSIPSPDAPGQDEAEPQESVSLAGIQVRSGINASDAEILLAKKIKAAGWSYTMPRPKSRQARWGNSDGRTTWWNGYWRNTAKNTYSKSPPRESNGFKGDGINNSGWRRGGSPRRPSVLEWLCSTSGGP